MDTITYAGVDLHKDSMTIAVTDSLSNNPYKEAKITKIHCKCVNKVSAFFANLPRHRHQTASFLASSKIRFRRIALKEKFPVFYF